MNWLINLGWKTADHETLIDLGWKTTAHKFMDWSCTKDDSSWIDWSRIKDDIYELLNLLINLGWKTTAHEILINYSRIKDESSWNIDWII